MASLFMRSGLRALLIAAMAIAPAACLTANALGSLPSQSAFRVLFLGGDNEELRFDVKYNSKERSNIKLLVLDDRGEALYENNYSNDINKRLTVPRLTDSDHVIFVVRSSKENAEVSYRVRITTRVVDDAVTSR